MLIIFIVLIIFLIIILVCHIKSNQGDEDVLIKNSKIYEDYGAKILRNLYIPYGNQEKTTEIDALMIYETGIYVFESKDYSGWIYKRAFCKTQTAIKLNFKKPK